MLLGGNAFGVELLWFQPLSQLLGSEETLSSASDWLLDNSGSGATLWTSFMLPEFPLPGDSASVFILRFARDADKGGLDDRDFSGETGRASPLGRS